MSAFCRLVFMLFSILIFIKSRSCDCFLLLKIFDNFSLPKYLILASQLLHKYDPYLFLLQLLRHHSLYSLHSIVFLDHLAVLLLSLFITLEYLLFTGSTLKWYPSFKVSLGFHLGEGLAHSFLLSAADLVYYSYFLYNACIFCCLS